MGTKIKHNNRDYSLAELVRSTPAVVGISYTAISVYMHRLSGLRTSAEMCMEGVEDVKVLVMLSRYIQQLNDEMEKYDTFVHLEAEVKGDWNLFAELEK